MQTPDSAAPGIVLLDEPWLEFRYEQRVHDPRDGLSLFGPCDMDDASHPRSLPYAVIGPPEGVGLFANWSAAMAWPHVAAPKDRVNLWPPYPGFEAAFGTIWPSKPSWTHEIDRVALLESSRHRDPNKRAFDVVNHYLSSFEAIAQLDERLTVAICVVPEEVYANCRPESQIAAAEAVGQRISPSERKARLAGQQDFFESSEPYQLSVDFRRQLKARTMRYDVPVQIVRESVLRLNDDSRFGQRRLTPLSNRMWNLGTALYYKGGAKPWRLATARDGVCYIGIAFRRVEKGRHGPQSACCAAQMFLKDGDGIVFLGKYGPWYSPEKHIFRLSREGARDLIKGALETYYQLHGKPLTEIFLHSRSDIGDDEFQGYRDACPSGVRVVGIRVRIRRDGPRLYRQGAMPVLRGTLLPLGPKSAYLFATGFKPRLRTYDGWEVPAPLQIDIQHGDARLEDVARDILGLTKLNYNACTLGDAEPATVKFSDAVGEILVSNPSVTDRRPQFRFYI